MHGVLLKLKPKKITVMPIGLSIIFEEYTSIKKINLKKMIIAIAGPIVNIIIAGVLILMHKANTENLIYANIIIAIFNLLPIYPLDGGRILKSAFRIKIGSKKTDKLIYYISNTTLIILTIIGSIVTLTVKNIAFTLIIIYLWNLIIKENKKYEIKEHAYEILEEQHY